MKKKYSFGVLIFIGLIILFGLLLIFLDAGKINSFLFTVLGLILIVSAIPGLISGFGMNNKELKMVFVTSVIIFVGGIVMLFHPGTIVNIIFGIVFIIVPLINLIFAEDKKARAITDMPKYIIGILIILFSVDAILKIIYVISGALLVLLGLGLLIAYLKGDRNKNYFSYAFHNDHSKIDDDIIDGEAEDVSNK